MLDDSQSIGIHKTVIFDCTFISTCFASFQQCFMQTFSWPDNFFLFNCVWKAHPTQKVVWSFGHTRLVLATMTTTLHCACILNDMLWCNSVLLDESIFNIKSLMATVIYVIFAWQNNEAICFNVVAVLIPACMSMKRNAKLIYGSNYHSALACFYTT